MRAASFPCVLSFCVLSLLSTSLTAQCLGASSGTLTGLLPTLAPTYTADDEGRSVPIALGFAFPMAGAPGGTFTHAVVESNGVLFLTNGGPAIGTTDFGPQNGLDDLRGVTGDSPRVFGFWADLAAAASGWSVRTDATVPGRFTVRWTNVEDIGSSSTPFSCSVSLLASGAIELAYGPLPTSVFGYAGVSIGNGTGTGLETSSVLQDGADSGSLGLLFQEFFDEDAATLTGRQILLQPNGLGGYVSFLTCRPAEHVAYGAGCYTYTEANEAMYQLFPNVAQSFAALPSGTSIQFSIVGLDSYLVTNGGGVYVTPPVSATILTLADDSSTNVLPSLPFPHANGNTYTTLSVSSNGFVNMAPTGVNPNGTGGSVSALLNATAPSFRSQRDYNPNAAGSGKVKIHEAVVGSDVVLYATWDGVFLYNTTTPERFQIQLNLTTGTVTMVWDLMTATPPPTSKPLLVGCAPGSSFDPGPTILASGLPVFTFPDVDQRPLTLAATPAPVFTVGGPTVPMVYTVTNIPDAAPPFGLGVCLLLFSTAPLPGIDLGFADMPGCDLYIASFDVMLALGPSVGTENLTLTIPQPLSPGLSFFAQALALFPPNSLPNGQNPFGAILSNGLETHANTF